MIFLGTDRIIEDILEEHVETLHFLWGRRLEVLRGPEMLPRAFADLEELIAAHTDALVLAGPDAIPMLKEGLAGEETAISLASGYCLLNMGDADAARLVLEALRGASGPCPEGLCRALSYGSIDHVAAELRETAASGPASAASAAAEALAFHGEGSIAEDRIEEFLQCEQAAVRRAAWRIIALLEGVPGVPSVRFPASFETFEPGLRDEDPEVQHQALETAAWTRQEWFLDYCRGVARNPSSDSFAVMQFLAFLGEPSDLDLMMAAGKALSLGRFRFDVLATFGDPAVVEILLEGIGSEDPTMAVAAASAYTKITGADIESGKRIKLPPQEGSAPDEFEEEFLEEATLPDVKKAFAHWASAKEIFSQGVRWHRGIDMTQAIPPHLPENLDNEGRWQTYVRTRLRGLWEGSFADLERFPLAKASAS